MLTLGMDVGGSGIKGALVDTETGNLSSERLRIPTPDSLLPEETIGAMVEVAESIGNPQSRLGVGFPAVVQKGVPRTPFTAHRVKEWVGFPLARVLRKATGRQVTLLNDADAAGLAEMRFGVGKDANGVVLLLTLGTGVGSALFVAGTLVPNTELGHVYLKKQSRVAEWKAASDARKRGDLSWRQYAERLDDYLIHLDGLVSPDLIIIGGGVSRRHDRIIPRLTPSLREKTLPAALGNNAGIIGAALAAAETLTI